MPSYQRGKSRACVENSNGYDEGQRKGNRVNEGTLMATSAGTKAKTLPADSSPIEDGPGTDGCCRVLQQTQSAQYLHLKYMS